jgi:hypothetical protein
MDSLTIILSEGDFSNAFIAEENIYNSSIHLILIKANNTIAKCFTNPMALILKVDSTALIDFPDDITRRIGYPLSFLGTALNCVGAI